MLTNKNTDQSLVKGLKKNDHNSFKTLFEKYSSPLFNFAVSYLKSESAAEDIVQEVFTKVWDNRDRLRSDTSFKAYLFKIALNTMRKQFIKLSKENALKHDVLINFSQNRDSFDENNDYEILLNKLNELIASMPEKRRMVFIKKKFEEKSLKEIAAEMNITTKTVEYHITEAMKFLKIEFEKLQVKGLIFFHLFIKK